MAFTDSQKATIAAMAGAIPGALSLLADAIGDGAAASSLRAAASVVADQAVADFAGLIGDALDVRVDYGAAVDPLRIDPDLVAIDD